MSEDLDRNQLAMELVKFAYARPVDTIMLINVACRMALAERDRAVRIIEAVMPGMVAKDNPTFDLLVKLRDKIFDGVAEQ